MFKGKLKLVERIDKLETTNEFLEKQRRELKEEVEDLKLKKKIEDEDIRHMIKMKEEKLALEQQKKDVDREAKYQEQLAQVKDGYRDKVEEQLETRIKDMGQMYSEILDRLPNVNVKLQGKV